MTKQPWNVGAGPRRVEAMMNARILFLRLLAGMVLTACDEPTGTPPTPDLARGGVPAHLEQGRTIFRFDTFGDETFWTDTLRMHEVIAANVSPAVALQVGLKVDVDALPPALRAGLLAGTVDLDDPATTVALLRLGAVVGLVGQVNAEGTLVAVGTTCALCHSVVDDTFAPGIGRRLDGWPNLDLNPGAIIALSPALTAAQRDVYASWGPI